MRLYDLRHAHASLLIAEEVHPKKVAERLGHASIKLTMDLYRHLFDGSDKESAGPMEKTFGNLADVAGAPAENVVVFPNAREQSCQSSVPAGRTLRSSFESQFGRQRRMGFWVSQNPMRGTPRNPLLTNELKLPAHPFC